MEIVAITGCNGFIGKQLVNYFINKGIFVVGVDISDSLIEDSGSFQYIKTDYSSSLESVLIKYNIDTIYHLAWCGVSSKDKNDYEKQFKNFNITYNVLLLAKKLNIKRIIIPGSMSEFSKCQEPVTGKEEDSPSDLYAATKVAIRKIAYQFCEKNNISLNWLLITSVYSKHRNDANLITYVINELKNDRPVLTTPLEQKWDYIGVEDLLKAMFLIGNCGKSGEIYPIGSGDVHPLSYYVNYIAKRLDKNHLLHIGELPYKNNYVDNSVPDISKLLKIGYKPGCKFEAHIDSMLLSK